MSPLLGDHTLLGPQFLLGYEHAKHPSPYTNMTFAEELYESLTPIADRDSEFGYPLRTYCEAFGLMFQEVADYARDTDEGPGWTGILSPDRAPGKGLQWLAQLPGTVLVLGLAEAVMRDRIKKNPAWNRGTNQGLRYAIEPLLTGTKTFVLSERDTTAYHFLAVSLTSETPDPVASEAALRTMKAGGLMMDYVVTNLNLYGLVRDNFASYGAVAATYATYDALLHDSP